VASGYRAVVDTNVIVAGLYSSTGASYLTLTAVDSGDVTMVLSAALVFEYEDLLRRKRKMLGLDDTDIEALLDQFCAIAECWRVHFLWRPRLMDVADDHLVELAVVAGGVPIVTHNVRHFQGLSDLGIEVLTPQKLLRRLQ
jgi:predicted nucleic acid-binding protein